MINPQDSPFNFFELNEEEVMAQFKKLPLEEAVTSSNVTKFVTFGESFVTYPDHFRLE